MARANQFNDKQYFAEFESRVGLWSMTTQYEAFDIVQHNMVHWTTTSRPVLGDEPGTTGSVWTQTELPDMGSYQFITLEDLINNYIVLYNDEENHGGKKSRMKIEAFAQRAVQEFSYSTLQVKDFEYTPIDIARIPLPKDLVELVSVSYTDRYGTERWLVPRKDSSNPTSYMQGDDGDFEYDSTGKILTASGTSVTKQRWDGADGNRNTGFQDGISFYTYGGYYTRGQRYYLDPERVNINGTYYLNRGMGVVDLDPSLSGENIVVQYISDGLSTNPSEVRIPKLAEQAVYDHIYADMINLRSDVPANEKARATRKKKGSMHTAKIMLGQWSPRELLQTLRSQARWIKT